MSQAGMISTSSGPSPPDVPTEFDADQGTAVPLANILIIHGVQSAENNVSGIVTKAGITQGLPSNEVDVVITNRFSNTVTTTDGVTPVTIVTALLNTAGTYMIQGYIVAYNTTDQLGATYQYNISLRSSGAALFNIGPTVPIEKQEGTMVGLVVAINNVASSAVVTVTGLAGKTINWFGLLTYQFIGV